MIKVLQTLNRKLPEDSYVIIVGLVNADFIYNAMAERIHPLGIFVIASQNFLVIKLTYYLLIFLFIVFHLIMYFFKCSGHLHKDIRYKDLYRWFNCMQIGPCNGWLNSDENLRLQTTKVIPVLL